MRRILSSLTAALFLLGQPWSGAWAAASSRGTGKGAPIAPALPASAPAPLPGLGVPLSASILVPESGLSIGASEPRVLAPTAELVLAPAGLEFRMPGAGERVQAQGPAPRLVLAGSQGRLIAPVAPVPGADGRWRETLMEATRGLAAAGADRAELHKTAALLEQVYENGAPRGYALTEGGLYAPASAVAAPVLAKRAEQDGGSVEDEGLRRLSLHLSIPIPRGPRRSPVFWLGAAVAATAASTWLMSQGQVPKGLAIEAAGWLGNAFLMLFPAVQIRSLVRDLRAAKGEGPEASEAQGRLGGISGWTHIVIKSGKLLQFPAFLASASPALMGNALIRSALSLTVLGLLKAGGQISWKSFLLSAAWFVGAVASSPFLLLSPGLPEALATAGAAVYALFAVPQYLLNNRALNDLGGVAPDRALSGYRRLVGGGVVQPLLVLAGSLLLVPAYLANGLLWVAAASLFIVMVSALILVQLGQAGLLARKDKASKSLPPKP